LGNCILLITSREKKGKGGGKKKRERERKRTEGVKEEYSEEDWPRDICKS